MPRSSVAASDPVAEDAARRTLADEGNAFDAVIAGWLGAGAAHTSVLLSPLVALFAGIGVGARCIDGRSCQPGRGLDRPRGLLPNEPPPAAAWAAAPRSLGAIAVLHAYGATRPLSLHARHAASLAKNLGATERARIVDEVGRHGASALWAPKLKHALLAAAGPAAGGLMSERDLTENLPGDDRLDLRPLQVRGTHADDVATGADAAAAGADAVAVGAPDLGQPRIYEAAALRPAEVIVAADTRSVVVALCYCPDPEGIAVPEAEIALPRDGVPVRRGVSRITPGTPLVAAVPIAVLTRGSAWFAALGVRASRPLEDSDLSDLTDASEAARSGERRPHLQTLCDRLGADVALLACVERHKTALYRVP